MLDSDYMLTLTVTEAVEKVCYLEDIQFDSLRKIAVCPVLVDARSGSTIKSKQTTRRRASSLRCAGARTHTKRDTRDNRPHLASMVQSVLVSGLGTRAGA